MSFVTSNQDKDRVKMVMDRCEEIKKSVESLKGIKVTCSNDDGKIIQIENIDYEAFDPSTLTPAFSEADGYYPEFDFNEKIDKVNKDMIKAGYSCNKVE